MTSKHDGKPGGNPRVFSVTMRYREPNMKRVFPAA